MFVRIEKIFITGLILFWAHGCTSIRTNSQKAEGQTLTLKTKLLAFPRGDQPSVISQRFLKLWIQSKSDDDNSISGARCTSLKTLSEENDFPLRSYAQIKFEMLCLSSSQPSAPTTSIDEPDWRKSILEDSAAKTPNLEDDIKLEELNLLLAQNHFQKEAALKDLIRLNEKLGRSEPVARWQKQLDEVSPRFKTSPEASDFLKIAFDYKESMNYPQALVYFKKSFQSSVFSAEKKWDILKNIKLTYKLMQNTSATLNASEKWLKWTRAQFKKYRQSTFWKDRYFETGLLHARSLWTEEKKNQALGLLKSLIQEAPSPSAHSEILFILGKIHEQDKDNNKAIDLFESALVLNPEKNLKEKILSSKAWLHYKMQNWDSATSGFSELAALNRNSSTQPWNEFKALFWQARAMNKKQPGSGNAILEKLAGEDVLGYYGLMASRDLKLALKKITPPAEKSVLMSLTELGMNPDLALAFDWAQGLHETAILDSLLKKFEESIKSELTKTQPADNLWLEYLKLQALSGKYLSLFAKINQSTKEQKVNLLSTHPELIFPVYQPEQVKLWAQNYRYSVSLIFSIIRQESAFNPLAKSSADALGLMQLLPSVARKQSAQAGLNFKESSQLYDPEFNIKLGAHELERLLIDWDQQYIPAITSYNASASAVKSWIKNRYRQDPVEFIEDIPYEETKSYVKLVLRNYFFYERILSSQDVFFDERMLKLKEISR